MCRSDIPVTVIIVDYPPSGCITADTLGKAFTGGKCNRLLVNSEIEAGGRKELAPKKFCSNQTVKRIGHSIFLYKILFVELIQQGNDRRAVPDAFQVKVFALAGGARPGKGDKGCFRQKLPANSFCERLDRKSTRLNSSHMAT